MNSILVSIEKLGKKSKYSLIKWIESKIMVFLHSELLFCNGNKLTTFLYISIVEWSMHNNEEQSKSQSNFMHCVCVFILIHLYIISKHEKVSSTKKVVIRTYMEYYLATKRNKLSCATRWIHSKHAQWKKSHNRLDTALHTSCILEKAKL